MSRNDPAVAGSCASARRTFGGIRARPPRPRPWPRRAQKAAAGHLERAEIVGNLVHRRGLSSPRVNPVSLSANPDADRGTLKARMGRNDRTRPQHGGKVNGAGSPGERLLLADGAGGV